MATHWGSKLGFIMATAGSAVGLGNIWRFPYLFSQYGGGAFLISYLICVFSIGIFVLMAKLAFGRATQTDLPKSFEKIAKEQNTSVSKFWRFAVGYLGLFNVSLVICVYTIVIAWTLCYAVIGGVNLITHHPITMDKNTFTLFTSSFEYQIFWILCCIGFCILILAKGIKKGIEKICLIMMPLLFSFLIFLSVWMFFSTDMKAFFNFLFHPDWTRFGITHQGINYSVFSEAILAVLGQSLYSLSLGLGVIYVYGSYMDKKTDIIKSALAVIIMDTLVAFLSGFIVVSALTQSEMSLNQGPELSFITLPLIFSGMKAGNFLMFLFFILLFLAALTSIISMYEVPINALIKGEKISRKKAVLFLGGFNLFGSLIVLVSMTKILPITLFGKNLFELFDKISGEYTLSIMMGLCCLFMGGKVFPRLISEIQRPLPKLITTYWRINLRWITPTILLILILNVLKG